jgi:tetratricopeptide (TPR) repeat protein
LEEWAQIGLLMCMDLLLWEEEEQGRIPDSLIADALGSRGNADEEKVRKTIRPLATKLLLPEIARELKVDGVVEGSVMRSGNRVRITAQLIHADTDEHIWGETYERDMGDVLRLQAEVAQTIAQQVRVQLTPQQKARLNSAPSVDPAAYDAFLQGRSYFVWGSNSVEGFRAAQSFFRQAIQKDPNLALAYVGLADSYVYMGSQRWVAPQEAYAKAHEALQKALALDQTLGEAHSSLGWMSWRYDWNWPVAEKENVGRRVHT